MGRNGHPYLWSGPASRVGEQPHREEHRGKTLGREDGARNYFLASAYSPVLLPGQWPVPTWREPDRVKREQQQQWRRQGVTREKSTVSTSGNRRFNSLPSIRVIAIRGVTIMPRPTTKQAIPPFQAWGSTVS